ncbi:hypothetical protein ACFSO7_12315 [Bacillus sp. CGMCC 1.16607]|uniref:hypothetical protein n=1 Tax=Bacillus sp. CGMCC 1.16607 TaxID=3351842 RepID=UPI00362DD788
MRKIGTNILILCLFCFPFVYFSMYQDFTDRSMFGYLIMIVATSLLAFLGKFNGNSFPIYLGNIASGFISYYFISEMAGNERWNGYFKPLTPNQFLLLVTFLNLIPQFYAIKLANKYKK